jgi:cell division transport system ATP-binding protein
MPPLPVASDRPAPPAIQLEGAVAGYLRDAPALVDLNLTLPPGATVVVHGAAGSGKSTLLHLLRTALPHSQGTVRLLGSDPTALPPPILRKLKRRIGYIAQTPRLIGEATAFDNIALPLRLAGDGAVDPRADADVRELMTYLGLFESEPRPTEALSDTQRRLVAIARAVVGRPDIVLADEPLAGLGPEAVTRVLRLLSELARQRSAVVIATQSPDVFASLAATGCLLEDRRLAA